MRYDSAQSLERDLIAAVRPRTTRRWKIAVAAVLVLGTAAGGLGLRAYRASALSRWADREAPAQIERLIVEERRMAAFAVYSEAVRYAPGSSALLTIGLQSTPVTVATSPARADVFIADYSAPAERREDWTLLGLSPVTTDRLPRGGSYRVRVEKPGFEPVEQAVDGSPPHIDIRLHERGKVPAGMVWTPGAPAGQSVLPNRLTLPTDLDGFWLDRYEVTNRDYKAFVDAAGYRTASYWRDPFVAGGATLAFAEAMARFVDETGRAGPAAWRFGTYPDGAADLPVSGVSWYEAAAYAAFAGKQLPGLYHWYRAAGAGFYSNVINLSNYSAKGAAPVGRHRGLAQFGAFDLAGNVKEWVVNATSDAPGARRFVLGGAWTEPSYTFVFPDANDAWTRSPAIGFRCARFDAVPEPRLLEPVGRIGRGRREDQPVDDATFAVFAALHSYDKRELMPVVEKVTAARPYMRRETISYTAAYGTGRALAHLFLPIDAAPPHRVVVVVPSGNAVRARSIDELFDRFDFLVQAGHAVLLPVLDHTLERGSGGPAPEGRNAERDRLLVWSKDLRRALDYAETRSDLDATRVAYFGISMGAVHAPTLIAVEPRIDTAVLLSGGILGPRAPEVDAWNYAPRVKVPVLMLNGRDDFIYPAATRQIPLFEALGTPAADKRRLEFEGGHVNLMIRVDVIREILQWIDSRLGRQAGR